MKVLLIKENKYIIDYLCDSIYHGLVTSGHEVYVSGDFNHLHKYYNGDLVNRKFTLYKTLEGKPNCLDFDLTVNLILSRFFDKIIISDIRYYVSFYNDYNIIFNSYKKEDIHLIDGTDDYFVLSGLSDYGTVWKRELRNNEANSISFAIPEEKIVTDVPNKNELFAHIIPGDMSTYIFDDESSYYEDYKTSYYGKTWKKGGWDCLRHYEILLNGCIPYFTDIDDCPVNTMFNFPKNIVKETNIYAEKSLIHPNYNEIVLELLDYTRKNLTTKVLVEKIINY